MLSMQGMVPPVLLHDRRCCVENPEVQVCLQCTLTETGTSLYTLVKLFDYNSLVVQYVRMTLYNCNVLLSPCLYSIINRGRGTPLLFNIWR